MESVRLSREGTRGLSGDLGTPWGGFLGLSTQRLGCGAPFQGEGSVALVHLELCSHHHQVPAGDPRHPQEEETPSPQPWATAVDFLPPQACLVSWRGFQWMGS